MKKTLKMMLAGFMALSLCACGSKTEETTQEQTEQTTTIKGLEDGTFTIAMECAYAPYNWTQTDDSNGAVPIKDSNEFANGYDIMIAKKICEANGWNLEVIRSDWDSLVPSVTQGVIDAAIAGQSMTAERSQVVDFAGPYYYATFAVLVKSDSDLVNATSIKDFGGKKGTAQIATVWYDSCLPQMEGAQIMTATETAPAMLTALETGMVDFVVTDLPTATGALVAYKDFTLLDFTGTDGDFQFSEEERAGEVNIGVSIQKGNTGLVEAVNAVLGEMTVEDFNALMQEAINIQPLSED